MFFAIPQRYTVDIYGFYFEEYILGYLFFQSRLKITHEMFKTIHHLMNVFDNGHLVFRFGPIIVNGQVNLVYSYFDFRYGMLNGCSKFLSYFNLVGHLIGHRSKGPAMLTSPGSLNGSINAEDVHLH